MFGINKNGKKHKVGIIMPAFFPSSRVTHESVTYTTDGTKTYAGVLQDLYALIDQTKLTATSHIECPLGVLWRGQSPLVYIGFINGTSARTDINVLDLVNFAEYHTKLDSSGVTLINNSTITVQSGWVFTLYYD